MKAGSELDALIAERVMGWRVGPVDDNYLDADGEPTGWTTGRCHSTMIPFRPSTDIAAAWLVVEMLHSQAIWSFVLRTHPRQHYYEFELTKTAWPAAPRRHIVHGDTAAMAICLAVLQATK